jgi:hypothetical protein
LLQNVENRLSRDKGSSKKSYMGNYTEISVKDDDNVCVLM